MGKIICDICGTSYAETAKQCPICGCVRPGEVQAVNDMRNQDGKSSGGYTYVKGGRFSKANVKKRTKARAAGTPVTPAEKEEGSSNTGLVITVIVLLLAIIGVVIYIALRFFGPIIGPAPDHTDPSDGIHNTVGEEVPCVGITVNTASVVLNQVGDGRLLSVSAEPKNTTDKIVFRSENEAVATVSDAGMITAVGSGTTRIIITCGDITRECTVNCQFVDESTGVETEPSTEETVPEEVLRLNRMDITFSAKGDSWVLYSGDIDEDKITWSSDDDTVATFENGKVVAVGGGVTTVYAEYEDQKVSCIIRCRFEESSGHGGNGGVSEDGGSTAGKTYTVYTQYGPANGNDITINPGDEIRLFLKDNDGNTVNVSWSSTGSGISLSGNTVKGISSSSDGKVYTTYSGVTYTCIIRVN